MANFRNDQAGGDGIQVFTRLAVDDAGCAVRALGGRLASTMNGASYNARLSIARPQFAASSASAAPEEMP